MVHRLVASELHESYVLTFKAGFVTIIGGGLEITGDSVIGLRCA